MTDDRLAERLRAYAKAEARNAGVGAVLPVLLLGAADALDEAAAEVEALRVERDRWQADGERWYAEVERLQLEVDRLKQMTPDWRERTSRAEAEVERLRAEQGSVVHRYQPCSLVGGALCRYDEQQAEVERLRAALRYISSPTMGLPPGADAYDYAMDGSSEHNARYALQICIRTARAALAAALT